MGLNRLDFMGNEIRHYETFWQIKKTVPGAALSHVNSLMTFNIGDENFKTAVKI